MKQESLKNMSLQSALFAVLAEQVSFNEFKMLSALEACMWHLSFFLMFL